MAADPLLVLTPEKAKDHIGKTGAFTAPGGETELADMIGAAVERVERHLGRDLVPPVSFSELMACKTVFGDYWETQNPARTSRQAYGGTQNAFSDDGPAAPVPLVTRLTALLGPPAAAAAEQPQGSFPAAQPWPDPVRAAGPAVLGWPR